MTSHVTRATAMLVAAASLSAGLSAPAMADETATPAMADNGTTQPAPSKPRETLQKAVEQAGKVDRTRNWKDQDALTTFVSALTTAQAKLADQTTADADLTAAETALTAALFVCAVITVCDPLPPTGRLDPYKWPAPMSNVFCPAPW